MTTSFVERIIEVSIKLAPTQAGGGSGQPNTFANTGKDTVTLSGLRTSVRIQRSGAPVGATARVTVWGMSPSLMTQLQTLGRNFNEITRNTITVSAGDRNGGVSPVFAGTIVESCADYNGAPNVPFVMECITGMADAVVAAQASSFTGPTSVETIMSSFARLMNLGFENNGITAQLNSPYFSGNLRQQVMKCAEAANINAEVVENNKLAIWPIGGSRTSLTQSAPRPLISADSGMIGYPIFWMQNGLIVNFLFDPRISFGASVQVKSNVAVLNGQQQPIKVDGNYVVWWLDLALDSLLPKGQWKGTAHCFGFGFSAPIPQKA